jgi:hypothetical protein
MIMASGFLFGSGCAAEHVYAIEIVTHRLSCKLLAEWRKIRPASNNPESR